MLQIKDLKLHSTKKLPIFTIKRAPETGMKLFHSHNEYVELVVAFAGHATHIVEDNIRTVSKGDIFILKKHLIHRYTNCSEDFALLNILFNPDKIILSNLYLANISNYKEILYGEFTPNNSYPYIQLPEDKYQEILKLALELEDENSSFLESSQFYALNTFMFLISKLIKFHDTYCNTAKIKIDDNIYNVIQHINKHYKEELSLLQLCKISSMSKAVLMQKFKASTGISPIQYQIQLRISEAITLLKTTTENIHDISLKVGFKEQNYFARQFKKITGLSPANHRKKNC